MNCVINFNKPENVSSQQAVTRVKRLLAARKAGHAGTLDPVASGVLLICLDEATKITRFLSDLDKEYIVRLKLGERTDTYDSTGSVTEKREYRFVRESDIRSSIQRFTGRTKQIPPLYSAIKVGGQRLYKLARKGIKDIERPERVVSIYSIDLLFFGAPYVDLRVKCSKGTYIRSLCEDLGNALGTGAHMTSLKRTRIGTFGIEQSVSLDEFRNHADVCHSIDSAISHLPEIILDSESFNRAKKGLPLDFQHGLHCNGYIRLKTPENVLLGIGRIEEGSLRIERLLN
ncbi:MAG: tRNA pseudouridine(55) synthase TruB [Nitrospirota bacterium]